MEPAFQRGDIMFLKHNGGAEDIAVGDIVVYNSPHGNIPIIHRVVEKHMSARPV